MRNAANGLAVRLSGSESGPVQVRVERCQMRNIEQHGVYVSGTSYNQTGRLVVSDSIIRQTNLDAIKLTNLRIFFVIAR